MNSASQLPSVSRGLTVLAIGIGFLVMMSGGAVAEPATASATGPDVAAPGETVTISVTISNTGESPGGYVGDVSLPDGWTVSEQTPADAIWNSGDQSWLWQSINAGESVNPSVTVMIPTDEAAGSYNIETVVKSNDGIEANATHSVEIQGDAEESTDGESDVDADTTNQEGSQGDAEESTDGESDADADTTNQEDGLLGGIPTFAIIGVVAGMAIVGLVVGRKVL